MCIRDSLTIKYRKAEQAYRQAATPEDELRCLQVMLVEIPKHKGTDKMQADLKRKISRLKADVAQKKSSGKSTVRIPRQGAGRGIILGPPNSGKSQLLASLTRATPQIADYPYTTQQPLPGMMPWEDISIQLIDTPPITADLFDATTQSLIRGADVVVLLMDLGSDDGGQQLMELLDRFRDAKTRLGRETCIDKTDIGVTYTKTIFCPNKIDLPEAADRLEFFDEFIDADFHRLNISAVEKTNLDQLAQSIYETLDIVRVYTKMPHREAELENPFTLKAGQTVLDLAELVHKDFAQNLKCGRVWGTEVHDGTIVKGDYVLHDRDIVELHM